MQPRSTAYAVLPGASDKTSPEQVSVRRWCFRGPVIDAGMLVKVGLSAAPRTKGCTADQVGAAVIRAIEEDQGEIDVAQLMVRVVAKTVGAFPGLSDKIGRQRGTTEYAERLKAGLQHLR